MAACYEPPTKRTLRGPRTTKPATRAGFSEVPLRGFEASDTSTL
jgi:hypothetical protein